MTIYIGKKVELEKQILMNIVLKMKKKSKQNLKNQIGHQELILMKLI